MDIANVKLDYEKIVNGISTQFAQLIIDLQTEAVTDTFANSVYEKIKNLEISVEDEQTFLNKNDAKQNSVHIVVKFGSASVNFGSSVCPINLIVWGTENKIKPVQYLLSSFATKYNLKYLQYLQQPVVATDDPVVAYDPEIYQMWITPNVNSNFTNSGNAFRSLFTVNGTIIVGKTMIRLGTLKYTWSGNASLGINGGTEDIPFLAFSDSFSNALNPQPFGNTFGFAKSEVNFSTYAFSISTYNMDCQFVRDIMAVKGFRYNGLDQTKKSVKGPNDTFDLMFYFDNGYTNDYIPNENDPITSSDLTRKFKLQSVSTKQEIAQIPTITMSFTH